jgi:hypothetical protein
VIANSSTLSFFLKGQFFGSPDLHHTDISSRAAKISVFLALNPAMSPSLLRQTHQSGCWLLVVGSSVGWDIVKQKK